MGARIWIDVTAARAKDREAIILREPERNELNPLDARRLADDLRAAADVVDGLCPPLALHRSGS